MDCFQCEGFRSSISSASHFLRHQRLTDVNPVWLCSYCGYQSLSGPDALIHCILSGHSLQQLCKSFWKSEEEAKKKKSATGIVEEDAQTFSSPFQKTMDESNEFWREEDEEDGSTRRRIKTPNDPQTKKKDAGIRTFESVILTVCSEQGLIGEELKEELRVTMPSNQVTSTYPSLALSPSSPSFPSIASPTTSSVSPATSSATTSSPPTLSLSSSRDMSSQTSYLIQSSSPSKESPSPIASSIGVGDVGKMEESDGSNRDRAVETLPSVPKRQTVIIPMSVWEHIDSVAVQDSQRKNMRVGGRGWREGLLVNVLAAVPFCQLDRGKLKLILKNPGYKGEGNYASFRTKCVKKSRDGEKCGVVVRVYIANEPDSQAEEVEWVVEIAEGDPVRSHFDPKCSDPSYAYHRYLITEGQRKGPQGRSGS